jgi:hypothetical protein
MKAEVKSVSNVYGYPALDRKIYKALKEYRLLVGVESLFSKKYESTDQITIVIDSFGKLRSSGLPILGYVKTASLVYVRSELKKRDIVANKVEVVHPVYLSKATLGARPSIPLLLEFNDCETKEQYQAMQDKYAAEVKDPKIPKFKWLRRNLNIMLKQGEEKGDDAQAPL